MAQGVVPLVVGGAFLSVAAVIAVKGIRNLREDWVLGVFVLLLIAGGIGFLIGAFISLARWCRFGGVRVRMVTVPGIIGGHFAGEVELPDSLPANANVYLELFCGMTRSGPARRTDDIDVDSVSKVWTQKICTKPADRHCRNRQWSLPFDFTIPYRRTGNEVFPDETDDGKLEGGISVKYMWHLCVTAKLPGPDLNVKFRVPVFKTEASDHTLDQEPEAGADLPLEQYLEMKDEKRRVRIEAGSRGPVFVGAVTPVMWSAVLGTAILGIVFTSAGIGIPIVVLTTSGLAKDLHMPKNGIDALGLVLPLLCIIVPLFISVVVLAFGAFLSMITLGSFVSRRTWVERDMICQTRTFLGIPLPSRSVPCDQIDRVATNGSSSSDGKSFSTVAVMFRGKNRREEEHGLLAFAKMLAASMTVGTDLPTQRETQEIIDALRREINQQRSTPLAEDDDDGAEQDDVAG